QHVALTYDASVNTARLYTNGVIVISKQFGPAFQPNTKGDLYFGFHPAGPLAGLDYHGGLDEFAVYDRALSDGEIAAIFRTGNRGKYGTNALTTPVAV